MVEDLQPRDREIESTLVEDDYTPAPELSESSRPKAAETPLFKPTTPLVKASQPRDTSWTLYAAALLLAIIVVDVLLVTLGHRWFWSARTVYALSLVSRFLVIIIASQWQFVRRFNAERRIFVIVNAWIGVVAGILLAAARFVDQQVFWTFINIITEPLDGLLLALLASWFVIRLHKTLTKPKYDEGKIYF